jgi:hypothetical protein
MHRPVRILTLGAAAALTVLSLGGPSSAGSGPQAQMAVKCDLTITQQRNLGTTYVITIRQRGTTCANARKVVKAYHRCRRRHGGRDGRCPNRVYGYRCEERRYNKLRGVSYDANARCKKAGREVYQKYQQNV